MIGRIGDWIASKLDPSTQRRIGVLMVLCALPLHVYGFFTDEPFLVYQMSAAAILFTGLGTIVAAVPSEEP